MQGSTLSFRLNKRMNSLAGAQCQMMKETITDIYIQETYKAKFDKYYPLCLDVNQLGFNTKIIVLIKYWKFRTCP